MVMYFSKDNGGARGRSSSGLTNSVMLILSLTIEISPSTRPERGISPFAMDFEVTRPAANEPGGNGTNDWHWITDANRKSQRIIREPFILSFVSLEKDFNLRSDWKRNRALDARYQYGLLCHLNSDEEWK